MPFMNAMRGQDAFFGGDGRGSDDIPMNGSYNTIDRLGTLHTADGTAAPSQMHFTDQLPGLPWLDEDGSAITGVQPGLAGMFPGASGVGLDLPMGATSLEQQPVYAGYGTIDPSLLGGPSSSQRERRRTPSPSPTLSPTSEHPPLHPSSPAQPLAHNNAASKNNSAMPASGKGKGKNAPKEVLNEWSQPNAHPRMQSKPNPRRIRADMVDTPSAGGKGKGGKGKGRAADVGYRSKIAKDRGSESEGFAEDSMSSKRVRKPSARAKEAREHDVDGLFKPPARRRQSTIGDDSDVDDEQPRRIITNEDISRLAAEIPYCHQCRNQNRYEKMRCSCINADGQPCGLYFCEKCIKIRCVILRGP